MADHSHAHAPRPLGGSLFTPFTLLLGVLAAIIPARRAAKLDILEAIHYE